RAVRRLRREGYVPGVVYGGGNGDSTPFKVGVRDLRTALLGGSAVLDLSIGGGKELPVIVKDQQHHPVRDEILHLDLLQVRLDEKIQSTVAIELAGAEDAPGAKEGGVLEHVTRELSIEALPTDIPERIVVDVSHMEAAATMHLSKVAAPQGVVFLDDPEDTIIATITVPTQVVEPEVEEETELVGEEAEAAVGEEAEGEAAEAPAEGGGDGNEGGDGS
ncbi:MAG: 50S ribosomal protein L25, partial [Actinobacteria bacterium]|nr:50S ribosomal protein L25 [Actinomycetota bacterium]